MSSHQVGSVNCDKRNNGQCEPRKKLLKNLKIEKKSSKISKGPFVDICPASLRIQV